MGGATFHEVGGTMKKGLVSSLLAVAALAISACSNASEETNDTTVDTSTETTETVSPSQRDEFVASSGVPGVTDEEISYAVIGTKTNNPLGTCILDCFTEGIKAYFAYRNSEGGIYGRDLVVADVIDDELTLNQQKSLEVASSTDYFGVFQATLFPAGWGLLNDEAIPTYTWGIHGADAANRKAIFPSMIIRCETCTRPAMPYIASRVGATNAASLGYGISETSKVCTQTIAASFDLYEAESGVANAYMNDNLAYGLPNGIGPEVTAMKNAGVDFIATCMDLNGMKTLAQELDRQGMGDVVLYHPNSYDQTFVAENAALFEGDLVTVGFRPFETTSEKGSKDEFLKWMEELGYQPNELAMVGWISATQVFDGLIAAGPEFNREKVISSFRAVKDYTAGGLLQPIDMSTAYIPYVSGSPEAATEIPCESFVVIVGGKFEFLDDASKPWYCWPPGAKSGFEPELVDFG
jgi:hypothetical protein